MAQAMSLKGMGAIVAVAAAMLAGTAAPAMAQSHPILTGIVAGATFHKLADMEAKHKAQAEADAAAGLPPKPSAMGAQFDSTLKERMARVKAEQAQAHADSGQPTFGQTFKERLAAGRAKAAAEAGTVPTQGSAPRP